MSGVYENLYCVEGMALFFEPNAELAVPYPVYLALRQNHDLIT